MYIKLNFTSPKTHEQVFRLLADIINNATTITSASVANTTYSNAGIYASDLISGLDVANSEIIAGNVTPSLTKAHICRSEAEPSQYQFTLEQSVYDNTSTKYYTRIYNTSRPLTPTSSVISGTSPNKIITFTFASAHGLQTGDPVYSTGFSDAAGNNGTNAVPVTATRIDTFQVSIPVASGQQSTATTTIGGTIGVLKTKILNYSASAISSAASPSFSSAYSSQIPLSLASGGSTVQGTSMTLTNAWDPMNSITSGGGSSQNFTSTSSVQTRCIFCYITDKAFVVSLPGWVSGNISTGWPNTYTASWYNNSNFFTSQYTRLDAWNTNSNGVIPVAWTCPRPDYSINTTTTTLTYNDSNRKGGNFGAVTYDYTGIASLGVATNGLFDNTHLPIRVYNIPYISPTNSAYAVFLYTNKNVSHGIANRYNEIFAIQTSNGPATGTPSAVNGSSSVLANFLLGTASTALPNSTLSSRAFPLFPLTWIRSSWGILGGGNISEQGGFYIFLGDYTPGDELTYNSVTYSLWPTQGDSPSNSRLALAVPKN